MLGEINLSRYRNVKSHHIQANSHPLNPDLPTTPIIAKTAKIDTELIYSHSRSCFRGVDFILSKLILISGPGKTTELTDH
jgi:hypothetical protein